MARAAYLHAADSGHLIWDGLATGAPLTKHQLLLLTGLTPRQFTRGMIWIKDQFQEEQEQPVSYDPRTHEYHLAEHWREYRGYADWTMKGLITRNRRFAHGLVAAAAKFPDSPAARRVRRDAHRLVDDLEDMRREVLNGAR